MVGARIFEVIDRMPEINDVDGDQKVSFTLGEHISFAGVTFKYPNGRSLN